MRGDLRSFKVTDFSGGLNIKLSPEKLARQRGKHLTTATNLVYNTDGSVTKRWGQYIKCNTATITGTVMSSGVLADNVADDDLADIFSDNAGKVYKSTSTSTVTTLKSGLQAGIAHWAYYNTLLIGCNANGTDTPQSWDGATWQALAGTPPTTGFVPVSHGNRVFMTDNTNKNTLYYSKLNVATNWTAANDAGNIDISPDLRGIMALVPSNQELIILKTNRPYRLRGIGPLTGYTVVDHLTPASGSVGTHSRNGAVFAVNDVWWVSPVGVHRLKGVDTFGDLQESFVSEPIEPYFRPGSAHYFQPVESLDYPPIMVYDTASSSLNILFMDNATGASAKMRTILHYDIGLNAWSRWTLNSSVGATAALWPSKKVGSGVPELACAMKGTSRLSVVGFDPSETNDIGDAMTEVAVSATAAHVSDLGVAGVEKCPRYLFLYFNEQSPSVTMTLNLYKDFQTAAVFTTTFSIGSATAESIIIKRVDLSSFTCEFLTVEVVNATVDETFTWLGYEVLWRPRREVRRVE